MSLPKGIYYITNVLDLSFLIPSYVKITICYVTFTVFTLYLYILFVVNVIYFFRFLYYALVFHTIF